MDWYIECGGMYSINNQKIFGRKIYIDTNDYEKLQSITKRFNNIDVYSTNYVYDDNDQNNSNIIGPLYLDFDTNIKNEESYNQVKNDTMLGISYLHNILCVPKQYIKIYFSGNKGFHLIVSHVIFGIEPCKDLNDKYKRIAKLVNENTINHTVDIRIYDKKRLIRMPHTINGKTGLYKVPITEKTLKEFTYKEMMEFAKEDTFLEYEQPVYIKKAKEAFEKHTQIKKNIRNNSNIKYMNTDYELPDCIKNIFQVGAAKGQRNNTLVILASSLLQKGTELEECLELMQQWNIDKNEEPLSEAEVESTVRSAYRNLLDGRRYGCASIMDLGLCIGEKCKWYKR